MQLAQLRQSRSRGGLRIPSREAAGLAPTAAPPLTARPPPCGSGGLAGLCGLSAVPSPCPLTGDA